jgi:hypothetical protein
MAILIAIAISKINFKRESKINGITIAMAIAMSKINFNRESKIK